MKLHRETIAVICACLFAAGVVISAHIWRGPDTAPETVEVPEGTTHTLTPGVLMYFQEVLDIADSDSDLSSLSDDARKDVEAARANLTADERAELWAELEQIRLLGKFPAEIEMSL